MTAALQYQGEAAQALVESYDPDTERWAFACHGPFWEAIAEAHRRGNRGGGVRIAILDSAFDYALPALARNGTEYLPNRPGVDLSHGTAVALLVSTVAPDAMLDLYAIGGPDGPDLHAIRAALRMIAESPATVLCMSLGVPVPLQNCEFDHHDDTDRLLARPERCPVRSGCLCEQVDSLPNGRAIFAAVGNDARSLFCPALSRTCLAIGFQLEQRSAPSERGESAAGTGPAGYSQSDLADFTLSQPDGALGSSFATPLIAGAAALQSDIMAIPMMQAACQIGSLAAVPLMNYRIVNCTDTTELLPTLEQFHQAIMAFPHHGMLKVGDHWCVGCGLYGESLYINAGLAQLEARNLQTAEELLRIALAVAPASPHASANLATCLLIRAGEIADGTGTDLMRESVALFDQAIALRPDYRGYDQARASAAGALALRG